MIPTNLTIPDLLPGDRSVLQIEGVCNRFRARRLERRILASGHAPAVAVDCSRVERVTLGAIRRLHRLGRRLQRDGGGIVFYAVPKPVRILLQIVAPRAPLAGNLREACQRLRIPFPQAPLTQWPGNGAVPEVSVCIRAGNGLTPILKRTLHALAQQSVPCECLILPDTTGPDAQAILDYHPAVRLLPRPPGPYIPAQNLNALATAARAPTIVYLNDDAIPLRNDFLQRLCDPLSDPAVAATYANQIPRPDANPMVRRDHEQAFGDGKTAAKWDLFFSLVAAAFRQSDILQHPFDPAYQYSEDLVWASQARTRHQHIRYAPDALVEHSHNYTLRQLSIRFYHEGVAYARLHAKTTSRTRALLSAALATARDCHWILTRHEPLKALPKAPFHRLLQRLSFAQGTRDYKFGKCER